MCTLTVLRSLRLSITESSLSGPASSRAELVGALALASVSAASVSVGRGVSALADELLLSSDEDEEEELEEEELDEELEEELDEVSVLL